MTSQTIEIVKSSVAPAAVVSPFWLPWLQTVSETAALVLPILGVLWLVIQMVGYFRKKYK